MNSSDNQPQGQSDGSVRRAGDESRSPTSVRSPLAIIEELVQDRAKETQLDTNTTDGRQRLRNLIDAEIERWRLAFQQGLRAHDLLEPDLLSERALRNLVGYGPLEPLLADDDIYEIMINGPTSIFVKRHSAPGGYHDEVFHDDDHVSRTLTKILDDAGGAHRKLDPSEGLQDAQLESGARLHIVHSDIGRDGHTLVNIRKFTGVSVTSLEELVDREMLGFEAAQFLRACIKVKSTVVFAGAPGSGKTTMLSCCAAELDPTLRVVIAEEVFEADVPLANVASMQTRPQRADRREVDLRRLVSGFLRMAPDIAIVGEVRDREVLPLLLTLSSGVKGFTTLHAGSARQALTRLRFIAQLADVSNELPMSALNSLISEAVDLVVYCARTPIGLRVMEIVAVEELQTGYEATAFTVTEVFRRNRVDGPLCWTGHIPVRLVQSADGVGVDLLSILHRAVRLDEDRVNESTSALYSALNQPSLDDRSPDTPTNLDMRVAR
jgi:pilus assembly protein CpaF